MSKNARVLKENVDSVVERSGSIIGKNGGASLTTARGRY